MEGELAPARIVTIQGRTVTSMIDLSNVDPATAQAAQNTKRARWNLMDELGKPPVAAIKSIVRDGAGLRVVREYLDTQRGNEALALVKADQLDSVLLVHEDGQLMALCDMPFAALQKSLLPTGALSKAKSQASVAGWWRAQQRGPNILALRLRLAEHDVWLIKQESL